MKMKKRNLVNMAIKAVALVDKGANKKTFFLTKHGNERKTMDKELAIELIKSGSLDEDQIKKLIKSVDAEDQDEVQEVADAESSATNGSNDLAKAVETIEKAGKRFSKKTLEAITKIEAIADSLTKLVETLKGEDEGGGDETEKKNKVKKSKDDDKEISDAEFQKMLDAELIEAGVMEKVEA